MKTNPLESDFLGKEKGHRVLSDESRPNTEALEEKRDQYVLEAVNDVVKNYDQTKIDIIAKSIDHIETDPAAKVLLDDLVSDIESELLRKHNIPMEDLSPSGPMDDQDRKIVDGLEEIQATYPRDVIIGNIKALLEIGYF